MVLPKILVLTPSYLPTQGDAGSGKTAFVDWLTWELPSTLASSSGAIDVEVLRGRADRHTQHSRFAALQSIMLHVLKEHPRRLDDATAPCSAERVHARIRARAEQLLAGTGHAEKLQHLHGLSAQPNQTSTRILG